MLTPLSGFLATHNPNVSGSWVIAHYTSIDSGNAFDTSKFTVDTGESGSHQNIGGFSSRAQT